MANDINRLGPKDFFLGCLVIVLAVIVVPILIFLFKVSLYLAIVIGLIVALVLGIALLGKVIRLIFFGSKTDDRNEGR